MPKIILLPPKKQKVFFQETQFSKEVGSGTDPNQFLKMGNTRPKKGRGFKKDEQGKEPQTRARKQEREARESLKGHPNEEEILKILRRGAE